MKKNTIASQSLALHRKLCGKIAVVGTTPVRTRHDLSLIYTPGVGAVSSAIATNPRLADVMTWKRDSVAVVSDGSAVLGLGNVGPLAALPVMEGKCVIFKRFANINAVPIVLSTQDSDEIVRTVLAIAPTFGAIQLEDISAPRCFDIEERLSRELDIPVMHDDQHGTAIVVLAGLLNALKVIGKNITSIRIVISGAGAAGTAIAHLLHASGVKDVTCCDRNGAIWSGRKGLNAEKVELSTYTNPKHRKGTLADAMKGADVLVGTSGPGLVTGDMVRSMAKRAIVFGLANPIPEIMPDIARSAGAAVVATGRSDFPNQVNNALCYPGLFRGMLDRRVNKVTDAIKVRAARAIAGFVKKPTTERVIPSMFEMGLHEAVAKSVRR
ncbi:MAG TPA: NADP-dependent malic enzyme [Candidatus Methylomirabilis sp.]|nr:NADP-dependent malic enzyme [Candidatus Methylomirabilis sp.]